MFHFLLYNLNNGVHFNNNLYEIYITTLKRYNLNVISFLFYKKRVSAPRLTYRGHSTQKIYGEALRVTDEIGKNYPK